MKIFQKLFTTITGTRQNSLGFILKSPDPSSINMYHGEEFVCGWNLEDSIDKIDQIILVIADTWGKTRRWAWRSRRRGNCSQTGTPRGGMPA